MNDVYKALADPTRREILRLLREREMNAGEIAGHFTFSKPTMSGHFSVLREADLIRSEKRGNTVAYSLNLSVLEDAMRMLMDAFKLNSAPGSANREGDRR